MLFASSLLINGYQLFVNSLFANLLGITIPIYYVMGSVALSMVINLVPISFLGIGTRDYILISLWSAFGINSEVTFAFSCCVLYGYIFALLVSLPFYLYWSFGWIGKNRKMANGN